MVIIRWLTGLFVAAVSLLLAWVGGVYWLGYLAVLLAVAGVEWGTLGDASRVVIPVCLVLSLGAVVMGWFEWTPVLLLFAAVPMLVSQQPHRVNNLLWSGAGIIWLSLPTALLYFLREEYGFEVLVILLLATWVQDSVALYTGKWFGGRVQLAPGLSPNKTGAGGVGAVLGTVIILGIGSSYVGWPLVESLLVGLLIGIVGQVGDLSISALKRRIDRDDTGTFFPGHGGILDRVDALVANVVVFYPLCQYLENL